MQKYGILELNLIYLFAIIAAWTSLNIPERLDLANKICVSNMWQCFEVCEARLFALGKLLIWNPCSIKQNLVLGNVWKSCFCLILTTATLIHISIEPQSWSFRYHERKRCILYFLSLYLTMGFCCLFSSSWKFNTLKNLVTDFPKECWTRILQKHGTEELGTKYKCYIFVFRIAKGKVQTILLAYWFVLFGWLVLWLFHHACILFKNFDTNIFWQLFFFLILIHVTTYQRELLYDSYQPIWVSQICSPFKLWNQKNVIFCLFANTKESSFSSISLGSCNSIFALSKDHTFHLFFSS